MSISKKNILLFLLVITFSVSAQHEKKLDSLLKVYDTQNEDSLKVNTAHVLYDFYAKNQPKLALKYSDEGLQLANKINYKKGIAKSYYNQGRQFKILRRMDSARYFLEKAKNIYSSLGKSHEMGLVSYQMINITFLEADYDKALIEIAENLEKYSQPLHDSIIVMDILGIRASVYMRQTKYKEGFESVLKALEYAEKLGDENKKLLLKGRLSSLYHYSNNKKRAIELKKELLASYTQLNDKLNMALTLNDLGNSNYVIQNYDIAMPYLEQSLVLSKETNDHALIGITLFNIGKTYIRLGQVQKGINYLEQSINYSKNISHNPLSESWALNRLGALYTEELMQPRKALPYLNRAIVLADSLGIKDDLYSAYRDRSQTYAALGNYKKALDDYIKYKAINDSVYNIEKSKEIERLSTEFETKEKERQIAIQKNEIDLLEQKAEINSLQRSLLGIGLGLLLLVIGFGYYGIRQKMNRNRLEKEKTDAELAFRKKELTTHALHLAKKNETLEGLKQQAQDLSLSENGPGLKQLIRSIDFDLQDDNNWENFARYFEEVHKDFNSIVKLQYPQVTSNELRLLALLKMNLSSKEIANILNISQEGIKKARYRLRKKLDLQTEDSLVSLVMAL